MKIAVLGTGIVGQTIATKLVELGHEVAMGSRSATNEKAIGWAASTGGQSGTFDDAAASAEVIFNCTNGEHSLDAIASISGNNRDGKILVDVANEFEMANGKPQSLASPTNSLGLKIQKAFPEMRVVKSLSTLNASIMVNPKLVRGSHNIFMSGDDAHAKEGVRALVESFGWPSESILDLGGIDTAVAPEMNMALWLAIFLSGNGGADAIFNFAVVK